MRLVASQHKHIEVYSGPGLRTSNVTSYVASRVQVKFLMASPTEPKLNGLKVYQLKASTKEPKWIPKSKKRQGGRRDKDENGKPKLA